MLSCGIETSKEARRGNCLKGGYNPSVMPQSRPTLIGAPWDRSSSFLQGAAGAPARIREALSSPSANSWTEHGLDLAADGVLDDRGDVALKADAAEARERIEAAVSGLLDAAQSPVVLGGDHSITYPIVRAFRGRSGGLTIVHLDAHGDLYDEFDGDRYSHACPFARIMEEGLAARLIQIGVRTLNRHQREQAARFGVEQFEPRRWAEAPIESLRAPVYVSIDLDVLDPAFAPGLSHPEPGGLSTREVISLVHRLPVAPVGADIVEYNPVNDIRDLTARVAARFVKEIVGAMHRSSGPVSQST